jgi:hypothetical protein
MAVDDASNTLIPYEKFKAASHSVYDVEPYPWQAQFCGSIIKSVIDKLPEVNLLVAPGGKSIVCDVCGHGITWTIIPLLSLGTDQSFKGFTKPSQDDMSSVVRQFP